MKQKITDLLRLAFLFVFGLTFATSCSETSDDIDDDPSTGDETEITISVDTSNFTLTADSYLTDSDNYITITGESDAAWSASSSVTWLDLSATSGDAGDIEITVKPNGANDTGLDRDAVITLTAEGGETPAEVTITQEKDEYIETEVSFEIGETDIDATGGAISATITSNVSWTAASDKDWVSVKSSGSASSDAVSLEIEVSENLTTETRSATVTVTYDGETEEIDINQAAAAASMVVTKTDADFTDMSGGGASATFTVLSNVAWTAVSSESWATLDVTEGVASTSEVTVKVTVGTNSSETESRTASIVISGTGVNDETISISQTEFSLSAELETLLDIKATLEGEGSSLNWSEDEDIWDGVTVVNGCITKIELPSKGLAGTIPSEIGGFTELETLDLSGNSLTGNVPVEFEALTKMTTFKVNNNLLSGTFPADVVNNPNYVAWDAITNVYPQQDEVGGDAATSSDISSYALKLNPTGILRAVYWNCGGPDWTYSSTTGTGTREGVTGLDLFADGFFVVNSECASGYEPEWLHSLSDGLGSAKYVGAFVSTSATATIQLIGVCGSTAQAMRTMSGVLPAELAMQGTTAFGQIKMDNSGIEGVDLRILNTVKYLKLANCTINMDINELMGQCDTSLSIAFAEVNLPYCSLTGTVSDDTFKNMASSTADDGTVTYVTPKIQNNESLTGSISDDQFAKFGITEDTDKAAFVSGTGITYTGM